MSKKSKQEMQISIAVPDEKLLKHVVNAYGLVSQYRTVNKVPHESMENWLLRLVVEGCNALYSFHNAQVDKQMKEKAAQDKAEGKEEESEVVEEDTNGQA